MWTFCHEASLPFLGKNGLLGCGITFDIFTHVLHGSKFIFVEFINITLYIGKIHLGDLGEGYKVIRSVKEMISLYKNNCYMISLDKYDKFIQE